MRQHHQPHVLVGIDAGRRHPEPQLVIVGRERESHAEGQRIGPRFAPLGNHTRQRFRGDERIEAVAIDLLHQRGMKRRRDRDRIAVDAEIEGRRDRHLDVTEPERGRNRDRREQMRGVEQADIELVADVGPGDLADQFDLEPFGRGKSLVDGNDQRCGVDQRNESDAEVSGHFNISDAVMIDWAISPIFFFSRIAVERSST